MCNNKPLSSSFSGVGMLVSDEPSVDESAPSVGTAGTAGSSGVDTGAAGVGAGGATRLIPANGLAAMVSAALGGGRLAFRIRRVDRVASDARWKEPCASPSC